jgi:hypothetical protein
MLCNNKSNLYLILIFILSTQFNYAQTKYISKDHQGLGASLEYGKIGKVTSRGLQFGFSPDSRFCIGLLYGNSDSLQAKIYGLYLEINPLKLSSKSPIGINFLMSYSFSSYSIHQDYKDIYAYSEMTINNQRERSFEGQSFAIGVETFIGFINKNQLSILPYIQVSKIFYQNLSPNIPNNSSATSISFGFDIAFNQLSQYFFVITPDLNFIKNEIGYDIAFSIIRII